MSKAANSPFQIALFTNTTPSDPFRKAVEVVHSVPKQQLTAVQRRMSNAMLKFAVTNKKKDDGFWEIPLSELRTAIDYGSKNTAHIASSAEALMSVIYEWDVLALADKRVKWKGSVMFPEVEVTGSTLRFQISSQMIDRVLNPQTYAIIDMAVIARLARAPAIAIYEFCIRYVSIGRTAVVPIDLFRQMILGDLANGKTNQEFKYFRSKVLTPCIAEINARSNIFIELVLDKSGGKTYKHVSFKVTRIGDKDTYQAHDDVDEVAHLQLIGALIKLGLPQSESVRLVRTHGAEKVDAALAYTNKRMASGKNKVDNPAAYLRQAIKQNWANHESNVSPPQTKSKSIDTLRQKFMAEQAKTALSYFKELSVPEQSELIARYNGQQATTALQLKKRQSKASEVAFCSWLSNHVWGEPSQDELLQFAANLI